MRNSKPQLNIARHTGRPERRLDSCAACVSTLPSNPLPSSPTAHYRSRASKLEIRGRESGSRRGLSGRVTEGGTLARLVSGVGGQPAAAYARPIHRDTPGSPAAAVIRKEAAWASPRLSGTRRARDVQAVPASSLDRRIMAESTHLGLTPSVLIQSCPSLGRSRTGGAVPPETNGHSL